MILYYGDRRELVIDVKFWLNLLFFMVNYTFSVEKGGLMCYFKLYEEYLQEIDILRNYIKHLRNQSKIMVFENDRQLKNRISILYEMYLDMKHTAEYLNKKCEVMENGKQKSPSRRIY